MITLRGKFADGDVDIIGDVPVSGDHDVLITFLSDEVSKIVFPREGTQEIAELIRSGDVPTPRELDVLSKAQRDLETTEIAEALGLADGTVRNYLSSIYQKLDARNRTEALRKSVELGLLDPITTSTT